MALVFVFAVLVALATPSQCLTWLSPGGPFAPFVGLKLPTYQWTTQWQSEDPSVWGKNYTVIPSPDGFGCQTPPSSVYGGKIMTGLTAPNDHCWPWEMAQYAKQAGAVGVLFTTPFPIIFGMAHYVGGSPQTWGQLPPAFGWGNINENLPVAQQVPLSLVLLQAAGAFGGVNVTLDYPSQNPLYSEYNNIPSTFSFMQWFGFFLAMCAVTFVSGKLMVDIQFSGFRVALPFVVLMFCYIGSAMQVFIALQSFAAVVPSFPGHIHGSGEFILFPYTCTISVCILIGFYFTEVSHLTSQREIGLLDKLKIPGFISIGACWLIFFVVQTIGTFYRSNDPRDTGTVGPGYAIAVTYGILSLFAMFVALYGGISLILAVPEGSNSRGSIIITVVLVNISAFLNLAFLPILITLRWWLFEAFATLCTERQIVIFFDAVWVWPPCIIFILVASVFRVSMSKEIELSKSATSSTSSNMSSKSTSSTSSANVVEL